MTSSFHSITINNQQKLPHNKFKKGAKKLKVSFVRNHKRLRKGGCFLKRLRDRYEMCAIRK